MTIGRRGQAAACLAALAGLFVHASGAARIGRVSRFTCGARTLYIAAHEDDPILFMLPDIGDDISAGRCVQIVLLTAGDAGLGQGYWLGREAGIAAAVAEVAGVPDAWRMRDAGIPGHPAPLFTLGTNPRVSLVFLRLPDGRSDGSGFNGRGSLLQLWEGAIAELSSLSLDPPSPTYSPSTYTRSGLIESLLWLMNKAEPDKIGIQDYVGEVNGCGDHSDHRAGARFALAAARSYRHPAVLYGYQDYQIRGEPANLTPDQEAEKQKAWLTYVAYDSMPGLCRTTIECDAAENFGQYWLREYTFPAVQLPMQESPIPLQAQAPSQPGPTCQSTST
jgi:LmbE family N-acetylglucosaminyl deacetylase